MNNNSSSNTLKKIKFNLEYLGKSIGTETEPYKTISQLKEKTRKLFFIINLDFKLIHSNKDLTPFDSITIGDYFKNKSKIHIKVIQITNVNYSKEINNAQNKAEKSPNNNDLRSSYISNLNNSIEKIKINDNENILNLNNEDINNSRLNTLNDTDPNFEQIENLNKISSENINISSNFKRRSIIKNKDKNKINTNKGESVNVKVKAIYNGNNNAANNAKNLCDCKSNLVKTYYCRDDNTFICRNCRIEVIYFLFFIFKK